MKKDLTGQEHAKKVCQSLRKVPFHVQVWESPPSLPTQGFGSVKEQVHGGLCRFDRIKITIAPHMTSHVIQSLETFCPCPSHTSQWLATGNIYLRHQYISHAHVQKEIGGADHLWNSMQMQQIPTCLKTESVNGVRDRNAINLLDRRITCGTPRTQTERW